MTAQHSTAHGGAPHLEVLRVLHSALPKVSLPQIRHLPAQGSKQVIILLSSLRFRE